MTKKTTFKKVTWCWPNKFSHFDDLLTDVRRMVIKQRCYTVPQMNKKCAILCIIVTCQQSN